MKSDRNANVALHKGKSRARIDPVVATAMALSRAKLGEKPKSAWADPDADISIFYA